MADSCVPWSKWADMRQVGPVQLWSMNVDFGSSLNDRILALLAPDEVARMNRYHLVPDRYRYAVTRAALRMLLSQELKTSPERIQFNYGKYGRPEVAQRHAPTFSVSHSEQRALIALCKHGHVGVDIQYREPRSSYDFAHMVLSPWEMSLVVKQQSHEKAHQYFYDAWTRKEAVSKMVGTGLGDWLRNLTLSSPDRIPTAEVNSLISVQNAVCAGNSISVQNIAVSSEYSAAVAHVDNCCSGEECH